MTSLTSQSVLKRLIGPKTEVEVGDVVVKTEYAHFPADKFYWDVKETLKYNNYTHWILLSDDNHHRKITGQIFLDDYCFVGKNEQLRWINKANPIRIDKELPPSDTFFDMLRVIAVAQKTILLNILTAGLIVSVVVILGTLLFHLIYSLLK